MNNIYYRLKDLREDNDFTQEKVCRFLNVKRSTYSKWENGENEPPFKIFVLLSSLYKININYLLGNTNIKQKINYIPKYNQIYISKLFRKIRVKNNHTQTELANILKCNKTTICNYESGYRKIPTYKLVYFCEFYKIDIENFIR